MTVLSVQGLNFGYGDKAILDSISFDIMEKDKVGLIGANGIGKTTLFKIIKGDITDYKGIVKLSDRNNIGYMEQHTCSDSSRTIYDELISCFGFLTDLEIEINRINYLLENTDIDRNKNIKRQDELYNKFNDEGGLTYKSRTRSALIGLGFSENDFSLTVDKLSGGQRSKLALAKLLLSKPNFLLLDEPTNHLDISSVEWLENYLKNYNGTLFIISHDRYFLDKITDKTIEITSSGARSYKGNYTEFISKREAIEKSIEKKYKNDIIEIERLKGIIEQQRRWNREKNIKTAESKQKEIERIKAQLIIPESKVQRIRINIETNVLSGTEVLNVNGLSMSFNGNNLFNNVSFNISRGERVFILGDNGCGKTTLFKILRGLYSPTSGYFKYGESLSTGYFDQIQSDLNLNNTAIDEIWSAFPKLTHEKIRNTLAAFLFKDDDVYKKLSELSGGERARIALIKLMLGNYNFLLLDEPTNHLDSNSREELERTLSNYTGTMLVISHDRYFINKLSTRILELSSDGITEFSGDYDYYYERKLSTQTKIQKEVVQKKVVKSANDYKLKKEQNSEKRRLTATLKKVEAEISATEEEIKNIEGELTKPEVLSDYIYVAELTDMLENKNRYIEDLYNKWEQIQDKLSLFE